MYVCYFISIGKLTIRDIIKNKVFTLMKWIRVNFIYIYIIIYVYTVTYVYTYVSQHMYIQLNIYT